MKIFQNIDRKLLWQTWAMAWFGLLYVIGLQWWFLIKTIW